MIIRMIFRATRSMALATAVFMAGCDSDRASTAPAAEQQFEIAAKSLKKGISVEKLKSPRSIMGPDGRLIEKKVHVFYRTGFGHQGAPGQEQGGKCFALLATPSPDTAQRSRLIVGAGTGAGRTTRRAPVVA